MNELWVVNIVMSLNEIFYSKEEVEEFIELNKDDWTDFDKQNMVIDRYVLNDTFDFYFNKK